MSPDPTGGVPRGAVAGVLGVILVLTLAGATLAALQPWSHGAEADMADDDPLIAHSYYANPEAVCGLFDPDEFELVLGHPYAAGIEAPIDTPALFGMPGMVRCVHSSGLAGGQGGFVATGVAYAYAEQTLERALEFREARDALTPVEVAGLGDRAFLSGGDVLILHDDKLLGVHLAVDTATEADRWILTRRLAEKALERLR